MRPIIDLTGEPDESASNQSVPIQLPIPQAEPPKKKRRVEEVRAVRGKRELKECLRDQVFPYVEALVNSLSVNEYCVPDVGRAVVCSLANSAKFRTRFDETGGWLLPHDEAELAAKAKDELFKLKSSGLYRIRRECGRRREVVAPTTNDIPKPPIDPRKNNSPVRADGSKRPAILADLQPTNKGSQYPKKKLCLRAPPRDFQPCVGRLQPKRREVDAEKPPKNKWFRLGNRPYRTAADRDAIAEGAKHLVRVASDISVEPTVYHVDFTPEEVAQLVGLVSPYIADEAPATLEAIARDRQTPDVLSLVGDQLKGRSVQDLLNFCSDVLASKVTPLQNARVLSLSQDDRPRDRPSQASRVSSLLLAREMEGNVGFGRTRTYVNFQNEFKKAREDELQLVAEYTNCAGDITAGSWVSNEDIICGTTAHSDTHNQQYNKPGNLLLCSTAKGILRAFPDHRIPRPLVEKGENSTEAMRQSQDPWLYSSVVSSDYDGIQDLAFTSSFDKTVKVWKVDRANGSMEAIATWHHAGNVNFVAVARDGSGRVATAADVPTKAVRVYTINHDDIAESPYQAFSCSRTDADDSDKWAYYPATLQWGRATGTHHLLLVGYSPRSIRGDDADVPEDKWKTGQITLWDAVQGQRVPVMTASTANIFEVTWHPSLSRFIVATTPCGLNVEHKVRTQIHVFQRDRERQDGAYGVFQTLDCAASDINELTFMPNSVRHAYVTAACTDGKVYVWDTAQGDRPVHVLEHGDPLEEFYEDREREDTGVKFTAWGTSPDRLYTGSSDGLIKVWNVRNRGDPFVRNVLEAPGPISFGAFSPDCFKLAIGDATGRVFILSVDKRDELEAHFTTLPGTARRIRRARPFVPHPEPAPPIVDNDLGSDEDGSSDVEIATYAKRMYLDTEQLVLSPNPVIGAVQGPRYSTSSLFRRDAHLDNDPSLPLLADFERHQRESEALSRGARSRSVRRLRDLRTPSERLRAMHLENRAADLHVETVQDEQLQNLVRLGVDAQEDWGFSYEELPASLDDGADA